MNHTKVLIFILAIFIALSLAPIPKTSAQVIPQIPQPPQIASTQPVYTFWRTAGKVNFTATRLNVNLTYYVWSRRPNQASAAYIGIQLPTKATTASFQVSVATNDPPGTYLVSLSTSAATDTNVATAHFGLAGVDHANYKRTDTVQILGGGYAPNSTIRILFVAGIQTVGNLSFKVDGKGEFNDGYKLSPYTPLGSVTVSLTGSSFDDKRVVTASTSAAVAAAPLTFTQLTEPPSTLERTSDVTMSWKITYPDGSPVTTSTQNSTRVSLLGGPSVPELGMQLSDSSAGVWTATWSPTFSATLGSFHFVVYPTDFDDGYGNIGQGSALTSTTFQLTAAHVALAVQGNTTIQRTLTADIVIVPKYHNGNPFTNVTQASGTITEAGGMVRQLTFNGSLNGLVGVLTTNSSTDLGTLQVAATVADVYGNTATGTITLQIVPAILKFAVSTPPSQRTTMLNVTARITYPDGALITQSNVPLGFNVTLTAANFTWTHPMLFDPITNDWTAGYTLSQNATLGSYGVAMNATDPYGNSGQFAGKASVIPATFSFGLTHSSQKANPHTIVYVDVSVTYPNGSALIPSVGGVVAASLTNSSGTFAYPMTFNATDRTWLLYYTAPDPGFKFGLTITFSFNANDQFGNSGAVSKAFELDVGAGVESLVLATVFGAIVPIGLIGWAIATVSSRRRKHKP